MTHLLPLAAEKLLSDKGILQAKELILKALDESQKDLKLKGPDPKRKISYEKLIEGISKARGSPLWYPYLGSGIGKGPFVELLDGSVKYDFISGIGTHFLGHSNKTLVIAAIEAALSDTIMQGHLQQNNASYTLMEILLKNSGLDHCFLTSSGAMANENALKIAFQKRTPAQRILTFTKGFAGRTLALAQISDKPNFRQGLPCNLPVDYIPFYDSLCHEESCQRAQSVLNEYLKRYPGQHAALCCELVQGEEGCYPGHRDFFLPLFKKAKDAGIIIIADEVQSFGRLERLFAFQYFGLEDYVDIVTIGKLLQVCATLFRSSVNPKPGLLSQTFTSSSSAIHAAIAIMNELLTGSYFGTTGKIALLHEAFTHGLQDIAARHPELIHGPFGIGAMVAFTAYDGSFEHASRFLKALFHAGVIAFYAGADPTRVRFLLPAGAVTSDDIEAILLIVEKTLIEQRPQGAP